MRIIKGDLVSLAQKNYFDVIIHGCNCFCKMGSGVAKKIKEQFPEAYQSDLNTVCGDKRKLGYCSFALCETKLGTKLVVFNAYTQFEYSRYKQCADYDAIFNVIHRILIYPFGRIGMTKIGCGLAGGDWGIVEPVLRKECVLSDNDVTVVEYKNRNF